MIENDLISRSALLNGFDVRKVTEYDESGCGVDYLAVSVAEIKNAPTVDAEPVRHGRWVETKIGFHCSECKKKPGIYPTRRGAYLSNYCPKCGAKMDGDKHATV